MFKVGNSEIFKYASGMIASWAYKDERARILDRHGDIFLAMKNPLQRMYLFSPILDCIKKFGRTKLYRTRD
jgi:hypothetical protein